MSEIDLKSFRSAFHGQVFEPTDVGYNEARQIWNASINKHPKVIVRCSGVADVVAAVNFGRENNLLTAIRGEMQRRDSWQGRKCPTYTRAE